MTISEIHKECKICLLVISIWPLRFLGQSQITVNEMDEDTTWLGGVANTHDVIGQLYQTGTRPVKQTHATGTGACQMLYVIIVACFEIQCGPLTKRQFNRPSSNLA
jgi:hypothetical protein